MLIDRYMKFVFTLIAVALTVIAIGQLMPGAAVAQQEATSGWQIVGGGSNASVVWLLDPRGQVLRCFAAAGGPECQTAR